MTPPQLNSEEVVILLLFGLFVVVLYFVPTIVAYRKHKASRAAILAFNFFLGWTFLGWVFALIWALKVDVVDRSA